MAQMSEDHILLAALSDPLVEGDWPLARWLGVGVEFVGEADGGPLPRTGQRRYLVQPLDEVLVVDVLAQRLLASELKRDVDDPFHRRWCDAEPRHRSVKVVPESAYLLTDVGLG